jgi:imidazolonepropionase-like amidohydrolase
MFAAGPILSRTGGHGSEDQIASGIAHPRPSATCDGTESCRRAVRANIDLGADLIKISVSGSASEATGDRTAVPSSFPDEVQAIVAAASQLGVPVAAHAHSTSSINLALAAGVRTIEHGTYFDDESARLFKQRGAYLVPTAFIGDLMLTDPAIRNRNTPEDWERIQKVGVDERKNAGRAFRAGIRLGVGTDSGADGKPADTVRELAIFVEEGVPAAEAIKAATVNNADIVGAATSLGQLKAGFLADIVAAPGDPLAEIGQLYKIDFVMKDGTVYKRPGMPR